jgi:hypothetical protein
MARRSLLAFVFAFLCMQTAAAAVVSFNIVLTIESVNQVAPCDPDRSGVFSFGCVYEGEHYFGRVDVDSGLLSSDGIVRGASLAAFRLEFGNAIYSTGPDNLTLAGFRDPQLGAPSPGLLVEGGTLVDFVGGVYGFADVPFIDMSGYAGVERNRFRAFDGATGASGSLMLYRVSAPASLWLVLGPLCILAVGTQRRSLKAVGSRNSASTVRWTRGHSSIPS